MNWKQEELAQELFEYVKKKFPHITFLGYWERPDGMVYIEVASPYDDGIEIIEYAGERSVEMLIDTGQQVMIAPYDNATDMAEVAVWTMRPELAEKKVVAYARLESATSEFVFCKEDFKIMVTVFLEKSLENLAVAEWAFENGHYNACANRAYYAMFQAALAALSSVGITTKTDVIDHGWVQRTFALELTKRRKMFPGMGSYLNDVRLVRNIADYEQDKVNRRRASQVLRVAQTMVEAIRKELEQE